MSSSRSSLASAFPAPLADIYRAPIPALVFWSVGIYLLIILIASLVLRAPNVMVTGETLNYDRALFLSTSTATLTGFQQSIGAADFNPNSAIGPAVLLILTIVGSLFAMTLSGMAAARILRLPFDDLQVVTAAMTAELLAVLAGTAGLCTAHISMADAVHQSACAFGNSGAVFTGRNHLPGFATLGAQGILLPLSIVGGLGLPVLMELYHRVLGSHKTLSRHCTTTLKLAAGVFLAAIILLFIAAVFADEPANQSVDQTDEIVHNSHVRISFLAANAMAINSRTAGLPFELLNRFPRPAQWLIVLLMMIGASPAGTGGGLKPHTFWHLFTGMAGILRGRAVPRTVAIAAIWLGGYLAVAFISIALLSTADAIPPDRLFFITISALSNVGMSHDPISMGPAGLFVLDGMMLVGRLAPIAVIWWMAYATPDAEVLVA